jgi:hypothetical protein
MLPIARALADMGLAAVLGPERLGAFPAEVPPARPSPALVALVVRLCGCGCGCGFGRLLVLAVVVVVVVVVVVSLWSLFLLLLLLLLTAQPNLKHGPVLRMLAATHRHLDATLALGVWIGGHRRRADGLVVSLARPTARLRIGGCLW